MRVVLLSDSWPWFGSHSGYGQLSRYLTEHADLEVVEARRGLTSRLLGVPVALSRGDWWRVGSRHPATELRYERALRRNPEAVYHLLYAEVHHGYLRRWDEAPRNLVATIHHPLVHQARFHRSLQANLARLQSAIVLFQRDLRHFESLIGKGRARFVPHGVDVAFFRPAELRVEGSPRILYVGAHDRDTGRFTRLVETLLSERPDLQVDLVVPKGRRRLRRLRGLPGVHWHSGISDASLRRLYQEARLLLLPLQGSGANNALLEALACGLPVVVNRAAGDPDYGAGAGYPLPEDHGDEAILDLVRSYLHDEGWTANVGAACRAFAESHLAWSVVARLHLEAYEALL